MPNKKITRDGTPRLIPEETMKEVCDLLDALLNLEFSPAGSGELVVNGRKAILKIEPGSLIAPKAFALSVTTLANGSLRIRSRYGTVNGAPPTGFSAGDNPPFLLTPVGTTGRVYLEATADAGGVFTGSEVKIGSTMPADSSTKFRNEIGSYSTDDQGNLVVATAIGGSQWFELCGGGGGEPLWGLV